MALRDRVWVATPTTGTGATIALGAAFQGYRTLASAYVTSQWVTISIMDGSSIETGLMYYDRSANTLTRYTDKIDSTTAGPGAFINLSGNATVEVAFLSRDNTPDWPYLEVKGSTQSVGASGFYKIIFNNVVRDSHAGWSDNIYTLPQDGAYDMLLKFRLPDPCPGGISYGLGVDESNRDSDDFSWYTTASANPNSRHGAIYRRVGFFTKGTPLRAFYYFDNNTALNLAGAALTIFRTL